MAIQMRRGSFEKFDPTRLLPGEFAIVLKDDDVNRYGKGIYMCFSPGDVQRISTIQDISENILQANDIIIGQITDELHAEFEVGESQREAAEADRETAEATRVSNESARQSAESSRVSAESARASAETARQTAEAARESAQEANDLAQAKNNADQLANNASALHARFTKLSEGQYDPVTGEPTITDPVNGVIYLTPRVDGGDNEYSEWFYVTNDEMTEGAWEVFGDPSAIPDPITTDDVDAAFTSTPATGVRYMALSSLNYMAQKLKSLFAAIVHKHNGSDINAATLPRTAIDESFEDEIASLESSRDSVSLKVVNAVGTLSVVNPCLVATVPIPDGFSGDFGVFVSGYNMQTSWESVSLFPYRGVGEIGIYAVHSGSASKQTIALDILFVKTR